MFLTVILYNKNRPAYSVSENARSASVTHSFYTEVANETRHDPIKMTFKDQISIPVCCWHLPYLVTHNGHDELQWLPVQRGLPLPPQLYGFV